MRIETNDPEIKIAFDGGNMQLVGAYREPLTLKAGKTGLKVVRGDFEFETDKLVVNKGEKVALRIDVIDGKVQVVRDGNVIVESREFLDADRRAAEWVRSLGGKVFLQIGSEKKGINDANQLPSGDFSVNIVDLYRIPEVNDAGIQNLSGPDGLQSLNIGEANVTDSGLAILRELKRLDSVSFENLKMTAAGLANLQGRDLEGLVLHRVPVTDEWLPVILGFSNLQRLTLTESRLGETALAKLGELKNLRSLELRSTGVTGTTLEKLAAIHTAVPGCRIIHDGGTIEPGE